MLVVLTVITVWYPVIRTFAHFEINYNEGWNAYRAQMAAQGIPLYGAAPRFTVTNYPPLSFHFIGLVGRLTGDVVAAGRYVSLISVVLIALLIGAIVRSFTGLWHAGSYAAFSFVIWLAIFQPDRIGMNDPQLFATVLSLIGLYLYVSRPDSRPWLAVSAVVFAVSLFTKHNLLAFPLAVGAHLLLRGAFQRFGVWAGAFAAAAGVLLAITIRVDGPYFWAHLTAPRPYSMLDAAWTSSVYLRAFQIPFAVGAVWSLWNCTNPARNVLAAGLVTAHAIAFAFSGGYGVDTNIFFDCIIALVMIMGVAAGDVAELVQARFAQRRSFGNLFLTVALLAPLAGVVPDLPVRIRRDYQDARAIPQVEDRFTQAVAFVAARPGRALCNDLLLCFEAGKPEEFMTWFVASEVGAGKMPEAEAVHLIETYRFNTIELEGSGNSVLPPGRFLEGFAHKAVERYRVGLRSGKYAILIPGTE